VLLVLLFTTAALAASAVWASRLVPLPSAWVRRLTGTTSSSDETEQGAPNVAAWIAVEAPTLDEQQSDMLFALAEFGQTTAREVMVSRVDLTALPASASLDDALDVIRETGHSRFPIYVEHLDNILGLVHAKDLLSAAASPGKPFRLVEYLRPALFVPETKPLDALLRQLRARRVHMAVVVDEYGGTAGLLTMEDLLEEIVGDMQDERDEDEALLLRRSAGVFEVDARYNLDDLIEELEIELETDQFEFDTLGGLIYDQMGAVPEPGATIAYGPLRLTVESVQNHRIGRVLVQVGSASVASN
jgi:CBS domain containing-hemolysin-like protein